jgi:hypothetical protein
MLETLFESGNRRNDVKDRRDCMCGGKRELEGSFQ